MPDIPQGQLLIYQDGPTALRVRLDGSTVWLTQAQLAELYQTTSQNITQHIKDIYGDGEVPEAATCKEYLQVRREGSRDVQRSLKHYSLDVVLAVGYRVRSDQGRRFRQWATVQLRDLLVKGFVLDDERLASGRSIGADYFEELLNRNQATDRAFRIGQKRNVMVHKFVCRGTIEERIAALIAEKRQLAEDLLDGGSSGGEIRLTEMSDAELMHLVALDLSSASMEGEG